MPMDDMYDDGEAQAEEKPMTPDESEESGEHQEGDESEEMSGESATLPSSICPGMKPGDEMVLKIDKVMDSEYVVSYAPKKEGSSDEKGDEDYE